MGSAVVCAVAEAEKDARGDRDAERLACPDTVDPEELDTELVAELEKDSRIVFVAELEIVLDFVPTLETELDADTVGDAVSATLTEGDPELVLDQVSAMVPVAELVSSLEGVCIADIVPVTVDVLVPVCAADCVIWAESVDDADSFAEAVSVALCFAVPVNNPDDVSVRDDVMDNVLVEVAEGVFDSIPERLDEGLAVGEDDRRAELDTVADFVEEREDVIVSVAVEVPFADPVPNALPVGVRDAVTVRVPSADPLGVRVPDTDTVCLLDLVLERVEVAVAVNVATELADLEGKGDRDPDAEPVEERLRIPEFVTVAVRLAVRVAETDRVGVPEPVIVREARGDAVVVLEMGAVFVGIDVTEAVRDAVIVFDPTEDRVDVRVVVPVADEEVVDVLVRLTEGDRVAIAE